MNLHSETDISEFLKRLYFSKSSSKEMIDRSITKKDIENTPTFFIEAAKYNDPHFFKLFIEKAGGEDLFKKRYLNFQNEQGTTCLMEAILYECVDIVHLLLRYRPNLELITNKKTTVFMLASKCESSTILEALIRAGDGAKSATPLGDGAKSATPLGDGAKSATPLGDGANIFQNKYINYTNSYGITCLMIATIYKRLHSMALLLREGADCKIQNVEKENVFFLACKKKEIDCFTILFHAVGETSFKRDYAHLVNAKGETLLMISASFDNIDLLQKCLSYSSKNKNAVNQRGETALMIGVSHENNRIVKYLLDSGVDPMIPDTNKRAPIHIIAEKGNIALLSIFMEHVKGDEWNAKNADGNTVLMIAINQNDYPFASYVLQNTKINIDIQNLDGNSALSLACSLKKIEMISLLLQYGPDLLLSNGEGMTAMDILIDGGDNHVKEAVYKYKYNKNSNNRKLNDLLFKQYKNRNNAGFKNSLERIFQFIPSNIIKNEIQINAEKSELIQLEGIRNASLWNAVHRNGTFFYMHSFLKKSPFKEYSNIDFRKTGLKGSFSNIYFFTFRGKEYIFKKIRPDEDEFKILFFSYFLQYYISNTTNNKKACEKYLCKIHDFGGLNKDGNYFYYAVMDNCGDALADYIKTQKRLKNGDFKRTVNIIIECAKSLKILHDLGYVHLDVKPANFLYCEKTDTIKVIDFGFMMKSHSIIYDKRGTRKYNANDRFARLSECIPFYDIYSLGVIFGEMITIFTNYTLLFPFIFSEKNNDDFIGKIENFRKNYTSEDLDEDVEMLRKYIKTHYVHLNEKTVKKVLDILVKMVTSDVRKRYKSVDILIYDLEELKKGIS